MRKWWKEYNKLLVQEMFLRLRNYPATTLSKFIKDEFKSHELDRKFKFFLLVNSAFLLFYYFANDMGARTRAHYVVEALVLFLTSFIIFTYSFRESCPEVWLHFKFRFLPGRRERSQELLWLHRTSLRPQVVAQPEARSQVVTPRVPSLNELEQELLANLPAFCRKYFNKSGSGFVRFYQERALIKEQNNKVDVIFVNYSLLIPRAHELSVDSLRKILLAFSPAETGTSLVYVTSKNRFNYLNLSAFQTFFSMLFSAYSLSEIERIFTNHHNRSFISRLVNYPERYLAPFPVAGNFLELENLLREKKLESDPALSIDGKVINGLEFKVLKTLQAYTSAGKVFNNCLAQYFDRESEVVILVYQASLPIACASVEGRVLKDLKAPGNKECPQRVEIGEILIKHHIIR